MGEYINIYGLLFTKTADGKLAFTGQIWDEKLQKFQSDINKLTPQLGEDGKLPADLLPESLKNATSTEVVESLPQTGEANKIYLVKRESSDPVVYDASMWIDGAWASFGGGENNALVFDQEQTLTAKQQNQVLANAGLNIVKIPSALFDTVLSDEDFAAIQNATAIIPIDGDQAGFIFTKAIITPSTIDFFSFNTNFSFRRATLTISSKRLSTLAATDIKDQVAVKYERQTLTPQQKSIARSNIGAIDAETVNGLLDIVEPTYVGVGGDDLSQYDIADDSPMYAFLVRLIAFMATFDETSPVFWFYSDDNERNPTQQLGTVVAWSNEEMTFIAMRPDGSISEYQIVGGETGIPTALNRLRTANVFIPQGAVLFSQAQLLSIAQKTQARTNIGAADEEMLKTLSDNFVMPMIEALVPMSAGEGGDDLSQYDITADSDMYNFLVRLIKFQDTMGAELTNQVFWFYTRNSDPKDAGRVFSAVISWASTGNGKKFTAIRANGDVAEYEITIDESGSEVVPTALTRLNHSNLFAAGTGAVLYDKAQTLQDSEKLQARENIDAASQADVDEINQILFTQYTALTMSRTPASFEKGVETAVTLNWSTKFNNQEVTPDSIEVKKGSTVLTTDKTLKTIGDNVSDTQAYSMTAVIKGITKTASVTVNAYYPMYFGASAKDALASADVLALTKQPIKSSPAGNVTVEVGANEYLWLCVPSTMTINSVKSGGFDVPMAAPVTVAVDGKGDYKCYRSAGPFAEGTFNGVIA